MQSISWHFSSPWDVCIYDSIERTQSTKQYDQTVYFNTCFLQSFLITMTHKHKKKLLPARQKQYQLKNKINHLKVVRVPNVKKIHFTQRISESLLHPVWLYSGPCFCSCKLISVVKNGVELLHHVIDQCWARCYGYFWKVTYKLNHIGGSLAEIVI